MRIRCSPQRQAEADEFYAAWLSEGYTEESRRIARQAFAGLLWSKQFFHYGVAQWLEGDPAQPPPPQAANMDAIATGSISIIAMSSRCRITGSIHGTPHGTWPST